MIAQTSIQLLVPPTGQTVFNTRKNSYTAVNGIITVQPPAAYDIIDLQQMGCLVLEPANGGKTIGYLFGANMNSTADQPFIMTPWVQGAFRVTKITCKNASISLTTAAGGIYPATAKAGTALVANTQVYTGLSASNLALDLTIAAVPGTTVYPAASQFYFALTTAQGAAATADLIMIGDVYNVPSN